MRTENESTRLRAVNPHDAATVSEGTDLGLHAKRQLQTARMK